MRNIIILIFSLLYFHLFSQNVNVTNQQINYGGSGYTSSSNSNDDYKYSHQISIGDALSGTVISDDKKQFSFGMFSFFNLPTQNPIIIASAGDYPDKIIVNWSNDVLDAPMNKGVDLYKNGVKLAAFGSDVLQYIDVDVKPGQIYTYEIRPKNYFGTGIYHSTSGFVNPNGRITGKIKTPHENPVVGVEVQLQPYFGRSINFNGTSKVEIQNFPSNFFESSNFTIEFWIKNENPTNTNSVVFGKWAVGAQDNSVLIYANGKFQTTSKTNSALETVGKAWHHYAFVYSAGTLKTYLNGVFVNTQTGHIAKSNLKNLTLGNPLSSTYNFTGNLDEFRIWNTVRDSAQIVDNMSRTIESNSSGLVAYWRMDEGKGEKIYDATNSNYDGLISSAAWSDLKADIHNSAYTDKNGNYSIESVFYEESGTTYTVTPVKKYHSFVPSNKLITLSYSATASDGVEFKDDSQLAYTGYVNFHNTSCYEEGVEIKEIINRNGKSDTVSMVPQVFTNKDGYYICEFEPGTEHIIMPYRENHNFVPASRETGVISQPQANKNFVDYTTNRLIGRVYGGDCEYSLGTVFQIKLENQSKCYSKTINTSNDGRFTFTGLPASNYEITVISSNPAYVFDSKQVDLTLGDDTVNFKYRAPIDFEISGIPTNECKIQYVQQNVEQEIQIKAFEKYNGVKCYLNDLDISINDDVSDLKKAQTFHFKDSIFDSSNAENFPEYTLLPGLPNTLSGGTHPYSKYLTVQIKDALGREVSKTFWIVVTGHHPREKTFTTTMPEIPFLVLHDPPGDQSYTEYVKNSSFTHLTSYSYANSSTGEMSGKIKVGAKSMVGIGVMTEVEAYVENSVDVKLSQSISGTDMIENTISFSETFRTSDGNNVGDVFIGAATNIIYGLSDVVYLDGCAIQDSTALWIAPNGYSTTFLYTESHIEDILIPSLEMMGDSVSVKRWEQILEDNRNNMDQAAFIRNVSFNGGVDFEHTEESTVTKTSSYEMELSLEITEGLEVGAEAGGSGATWSIAATKEIANTISNENSQSNTITSTYVLSDDDNDYFSVDVLADPVYGTPCFRIVAGATACPWEEGTQKRENVSLSIESVGDNLNVDPNVPAVFKLIAGNTSETNEDHEYRIRIVNESNPWGALVKFNGQALASADIPLVIPAGKQLEYTLTVEKGPANYEYDNLCIMIYSACEYENWVSDGGEIVISDSVFFNVHYIEPCANNIKIYAPLDDFLINKKDSIQNLGITGYNKLDSQFDYLLVQYQHINGSNNWVVSDTIWKDSIPLNYFMFAWDATRVGTGDYQLRVVNVCKDGTQSTSNRIYGIVDREAPILFNEISPIDKVLNVNDEIILTFDENLNVEKLTPNFVHLYNESTGLDVPFNYLCVDNKISIHLDVQNRYIENCYLKLTIDQVEDLYANVSDNSIEYIFFVDRNPIHWNQNSLNFDARVGVDTVFYTTIHNNGTQDVKFKFNSQPWIPNMLDIELPEFISCSPASGDLNVGGEATIAIKVKGVFNAGPQKMNIYLHTPDGDDHCELNVNYLCEEPIWELNDSDFEYNMNVNAQVINKGKISTDVNDIIGAFVGDECRGKAHVTHELILGEIRDSIWFDDYGIKHSTVVRDTLMNKYMVYLTIHSNISKGDTIHFKLWSARECEEYWDLDQKIVFNTGDVIGAIKNPFSFTSSGNIMQEMRLKKGWNWFSTFVQNDKKEKLLINSIFSHDTHFSKDDKILSQTSFEAFSTSSDKWVPGLMSFDFKKMYMADVNVETDLRFIGLPIKGQDLKFTAQPGWNWIGYPLKDFIEINKAIVGEYPDGTLIKSVSVFAEYLADIKSWVGSLRYLRPNQGYMMHIPGQNAVDYEYNIDAATNMINSPMRVKTYNEESEEFFEYQFNMPVIASVDSKILSSFTSPELIATVAGEVRARSRFNSEGLSYLMIHSNKELNEVVEFKVIDTDNNSEILSNSKVIFNQNNIIGSSLQPYKLNFTQNESLFFDAYPVPAKNNMKITVSAGSINSNMILIKVYDILGQNIKSFSAGLTNSSYIQFDWDLRDSNGNKLIPGLYLMQLEVNGTKTHKTIIIE